MRSLNGPPIYLKLPPVAGVSKLVAALTVALAAVPVSDGALRAEVDRLVVALAAARQLPYHGELPAQAVTREAAAREIAVATGIGVSSRPGDLEGEILERLGLVPAGADPGALLARTIEPSPFASPSLGTKLGTSLGTTSGISPDVTYDLASGRLLVPDFVPLEDQRIALSHQIAHAIADQHFGLRDFLKLSPDGGRGLESDAQRARLAVVEGDASLSALELTDPREEFLGTTALSTLAGRLRRAIATPGARPWFGELQGFTHVDGFLFVARARARGPWSAVDALWTDPPASTEQVLHPEKYDACEPPVVVDQTELPTLPGFGRPAASDVLGELETRAWLASVLPAEIAARAAAGWGGDRAGVYTAKPGASPDGGAASAIQRPLAWLTVWDDAGEAEDFARGAARVLAAQATGQAARRGTNDEHRGPAGTASDGDRAIFPSPAGAYALGRRGEVVALLFAAPDPVPAALDQMLEGWRRRPTATRRGAPRPRRAAPPGCPRRDRAAGRE
jgi:hypothetical protein